MIQNGQRIIVDGDQVCRIEKELEAAVGGACADFEKHRCLLRKVEIGPNVANGVILVSEGDACSAGLVHPCGQPVGSPGDSVSECHAGVILSGGNAQEVDLEPGSRVDILAQFMPMAPAFGRVRMGEIGVGDHAGDNDPCIVRLLPQFVQISVVERVQVRDTDVGSVKVEIGCQVEPVGQRSLPSADFGVKGRGEAGKRHGAMIPLSQRPNLTRHRRKGSGCRNRRSGRGAPVLTRVR